MAHNTVLARAFANKFHDYISDNNKRDKTRDALQRRSISGDCDNQTLA